MTNFLNNKNDKIFGKLFEYVKKNNYEGNDLFDGLNSKLFKNTPLCKSRFFRLALIQFCKLSPIDFRRLIFVPKGFNSKAGALFLLGNLNMFKLTGDERYKQEAIILYEKIKKTAIKRKIGIGWGYNFEWQARAFHVPMGTPNIVPSVYVANALIEYYRIFNENEALELAREVSDFILNEMILYEDENKLCFRYIPGEDTQIHNASLLAASFLSTVEKYFNSDDIKNKVKKAVNFSISDINENGSWPYGTKPFHRWVDNFHTAFNIESLIEIRNNLDWHELNPKIEKVIDYYLNNLFTQKGLPKYYNTKLYPIDIHVIAETIVVFDRIKGANIEYNKSRLDCINTQIIKLIEEFQNKKGYFYFQKNKYFWNKIPYIRWAQAWMFYALSLKIKEG